LYKYLLSIYQGKYTTALRVASLVENVDYFISCAMDAHEQAMFSFISPKLLTAYSDRWTSMLTDKGITRDVLDVEVMADILDEMVKSVKLVKERTVEGNHVLVALTARLVTTVRKNTKSGE
jgi:hypothetical protein